MDPDPRLRSARLHAGIDRLDAQVGLTWAKEARLLTELGLREGMSVLDLGCGPGFFAERLLSAVPALQLTAVDLDPNMAALARARLGGRAEVLEAAATNLDLLEESFDLAVARFLFQHVHAPDLAAAELFDVLKPGGRAVIIDIDTACGGFVAPSFPELEAVQRGVTAMQATSSGDREIGRKLWAVLASAGFHDLALHAIPVSSDEVGLAAFWPQYGPSRFRPFVGPTGISEDEWSAYAAVAGAFFARPDAYILELYLVVTGIKPDTAQTPPPGGD
jgi:SAM-dependent methyltransferase